MFLGLNVENARSFRSDARSFWGNDRGFSQKALLCARSRYLLAQSEYLRGGGEYFAVGQLYSVRRNGYSNAAISRANSSFQYSASRGSTRFGQTGTAAADLLALRFGSCSRFSTLITYPPL
jgi:hypothetical protein